MVSSGRIGVSALVLLGLAAQGCTAPASTGNHGPVRLSVAPASAFAPIWINAEVRPIGPLRAVGDVMVGMILANGWPYLTAIDPATGNQLWREPMSYSATTVGVAADFLKIGDDRIAYLHDRSGGGYAQIIVANARTGQGVSASPPLLFTSLPSLCDNHRDVCAISEGIPGGIKRRYRLSVSNDDYTRDSDALPPGARILEGPNLLDLGDRPENTLAWLHRGAFAWRIAAADAFGPGFSSDNGWRWKVFSDQDVLVGTVYGESRYVDGASVFDLARGSATAGIRASTGAILWRDHGTSLWCNLPEEHPTVRCRLRGTLTATDQGIRFAQLDVAIEGFDLTTGKTTWSIPLGAATELIGSREAVRVAGASQIVVTTPTGPAIVDYSRGELSAAAPGGTYWCLATAHYFADGRQRTGGHIASVCDAQGHPARALPGADATLAAAAQVGSYAVITGAHGYMGFRLH